MSFPRMPLCLFALLLSSCLSAQQFGGNPPSLRWRQINTDTARIIFPRGLEFPAQEVAAIVHTLSRTTLPTIGGRQHKINIVFQNQTTIPNGYVGLAPFRSEFQLTPEQNSLELGSLPWQKTLAIHEYRHVQQYNNFRVGLSGAFYYLFGEGGQALANSLAIPNWFWEGDAVYQETLISRQGRGRLPFFFSGYRSLWAADKRYSWMKLRNGSYRDYIPDHYPLGYMLVAYGREKYGDDFWKNVTVDAARFKGLFYPLQSGVKRYAGIPFSQFRRDALDHFKTTEPPHADQARADEFARTHRHFQGDQQFPRLIGPDSLLYLSSSYRKIPSFIIKAHNREHKLRARSIAIDDYFSYGHQKIVYAAYETDPRWGWRDYSVIRIMDVTTGQDTRLTAKSRYFAPDISPDGRQLVAVNVPTNGLSQLHLLDAATGAVQQELPNRDSLFYTYPKYYGKDLLVSPVRNTRGEMSLALIHIPDGRVDPLLPFTSQAIAFPSIHGDSVWFTASRDNRDNVYCFTGTKLFQVRLPHGVSPTGDYGFNATDHGYAWSTFTAVGLRADTTTAANLNLEPISVDAWQLPLALQGIDSLNNDHSAGVLNNIRPANYPVNKYSNAFHLINIHSWRPYISDPDYTFSLVSENILNTLQSEIFFDYNRNEKYKQVGLDATYGALFPWLDIGVNYIFDRNAPVSNSLKAYFNEANAYIGYSIPLSWARGRSFTGLQFGTDWVYSRQYFQGLYKDSGLDRHFSYLRNFVSLTNQVQKAPAQIYPRFAQTLYLLYDQSVSSINSHQFTASGYLYLPGMDYTHSLQIGAAWQSRDQRGAGGYSNAFPWARGYGTANLYQMWRVTGNYHFPLLYPDAGIGNIAYLLRVRANAFYDYMKGLFFLRSGGTIWLPFRSYGMEMYFDTKWWNELPISFGIRYSRLVDDNIFEVRGPNQWELILPLNILSQGYSSKGIRSIN